MDESAWIRGRLEAIQERLVELNDARHGLMRQITSWRQRSPEVQGLAERLMHGLQLEVEGLAAQQRVYQELLAAVPRLQAKTRRRLPRPDLSWPPEESFDDLMPRLLTNPLDGR
jgi:hypothetical protein